MTTEDDFQTALDADPTDWQTRLVLADWLDERADPRAAGYRALGALRKWPCAMYLSPYGGDDDGETGWFFWCHGSGANAVSRVAAEECPHAGLPPAWFKLVDDGTSLNPDFWRGYTKTRREAEDDAARAFAAIPDACRAELVAAGPDNPKEQE